MRLWSTVVTHDVTRPRRQSARYVSVLTATRRPLVDVLLQVRVQRGELVVGPPARNRRHVARDRLDPVLAVNEQLAQARRLHEQRVGRDVRAVAALALRSVALGADADPLIAAEVGRSRSREPRLVVAPRLRDHLSLHLCVEDTAELAAASAIRPDLVRLEPRVSVPAGNGVELAAELRNPPAVIDVLRVDLDADDAVHRDVHLVDRDCAGRIRELPVELVRVDSDLERPALRLGRGNVLDPGQLVEDEAGDRREYQDRDRRPDQLEARGAVDLWAFGRAGAAAPAVADDEPDEGPFDEDEDRGGEHRDPLEGAVDAGRVGRVRRLRREPAVARMSDGDERQRGAESKHEDKGLAPHRQWHPTMHGVVAYPTTTSCGRWLRGVRERRPPGAGTRLRPDRRRARLPPRPGTGRTTGPDPLALDAARRRGHLPQARDRRRDLRGRRPPHGGEPHPCLARSDPVLRHRLEPVANPVPGLDERMARRPSVDLVAEAAHEDVDRPVAVRLPPAPDLLQQLVAGDHAAALQGELIEEPELRRRQLGALTVDERLYLARVDPQLLDVDGLTPWRVLAAGRPSRRRAHTRDQLLHREWLDEVVVRTDLEGVHTVVLRPTRGHDDDRRPDPF